MQGEAKTWQMEETVHRVHTYSYPIHLFASVSQPDGQISVRLTGGRLISLF